MENWILMYNPASGGGKRVRSRLDSIIEIFQSSDKLITAYRLDAANPTSIETVLDSGKYDGIIACGGDGTVNFVGSLLARKGLSIPMGVIPTGTCNDFARSIGLPTDIIKCAKRLAQGNIRKIDVGKINEDTYFINELAGGILVDVSFSVDDSLKQRFGSLAYYMAGAEKLTKLKTFPITIETAQGEKHEIDAYLFLMLNGTDVAGMSGMIKDAVMDDGMLDILVFKKSNLIDVTDTLLKLLTNARFRDSSVVRIRTSACRITCKEQLVTTLDGEKGPMLPLHIEMQKQAINVLY